MFIPYSDGSAVVQAQEIRVDRRLATPTGLASALAEPDQVADRTAGRRRRPLLRAGRALDQRSAASATRDQGERAIPSGSGSIRDSVTRPITSAIRIGSPPFDRQLRDPGARRPRRQADLPERGDRPPGGLDDEQVHAEAPTAPPPRARRADARDPFDPDTPSRLPPTPHPGARPVPSILRPDHPSCGRPSDDATSVQSSSSKFRRSAAMSPESLSIRSPLARPASTSPRETHGPRSPPSGSRPQRRDDRPGAADLGLRGECLSAGGATGGGRRRGPPGRRLTGTTVRPAQLHNGPHGGLDIVQARLAGRWEPHDTRVPGMRCSPDLLLQHLPVIGHQDHVTPPRPLRSNARTGSPFRPFFPRLQLTHQRVAHPGCRVLRGSPSPSRWARTELHPRGPRESPLNLLQTDPHARTTAVRGMSWREGQRRGDALAGGRPPQ